MAYSVLLHITHFGKCSLQTMHHYESVMFVSTSTVSANTITQTEGKSFVNVAAPKLCSCVKTCNITIVKTALEKVTRGICCYNLYYYVPVNRNFDLHVEG